MNLLPTLRALAPQDVNGLRLVALALLCLSLLLPGMGHAEASHMWQPREFEFVAYLEHEHPMLLALDVKFVAPDRAEYVVPAFWDGGNRWKVRFAPTQEGEWAFSTTLQNLEDKGLGGQSGSFNVLPPSGANPLFLHGGFLKVNPPAQYLAYSDGTPFFWLGDTWWYCPSKLCPLNTSSAPDGDSMFKALVDKRAGQGYTPALMLLGGPKNSPVNLHAPQQWNDADIEFWREVDQYIGYAAEKGILCAIGSGWHNSFDKPELQDLKLLWRYIIARLGAFPVTWIIAGEYNLFHQETRIRKIMDLGGYIREIDPYKRAMSVHPWAYSEERRQAWAEPWYDFIMIQGGHGAPVAPKDYLRARQSGKPFLESEARYEGIRDFKDKDVRLVAYRAMQSGSLGYTYGSHGLWHPIHSLSERKENVDKWGKPLPWWEALERPGGHQMSYLKKVYESIEWWKLKPRTDAVIMIGNRHNSDIMAAHDDDGLHVVYFPPDLDLRRKALLKDPGSDFDYAGQWFDPRTGEFAEIPEQIERDNRFVFLPTPPSTDDWLLILRRK